MKRRIYFRKTLIFETSKACGEIHKHAESDSTLGFYEPIATTHLVIAINGVMDSIGKVKKQNDQPDQDYKNTFETLKLGRVLKEKGGMLERVSGSYSYSQI